jgi:predicted HTH domain antitoxin
MATSKTERVEIDLPKDIIFAMRGLEKPEEVKKKLKIALAILLFQERSISLGKATELSEMSRVRFMEVLKEHGIPAYAYDERDFEKDQQMVAEYRETLEK